MRLFLHLGIGNTSPVDACWIEQDHLVLDADPVTPLKNARAKCFRVCRIGPTPQPSQSPGGVSYSSSKAPSYQPYQDHPATLRYSLSSRCTLDLKAEVEDRRVCTLIFFLHLREANKGPMDAAEFRSRQDSNVQRTPSLCPLFGVFTTHSPGRIQKLDPPWGYDPHRRSTAVHNWGSFFGSSQDSGQWKLSPSCWGCLSCWPWFAPLFLCCSCQLRPPTPQVRLLKASGSLSDGFVKHTDHLMNLFPRVCIRGLIF